ncbi:hypothetical protein [Methylobacterium oryzae]
MDRTRGRVAAGSTLGSIQYHSAVTARVSRTGTEMRGSHRGGM